MTLPRHLGILIAISLLIPLSVMAQNKKAEMDALLSKYHEYDKFNGVALVAEGDDILYEKGFGKANMAWNIPNTPETKFRIGSVTKQFTAAIIMQLVEERKLALEGKITDYLPDYPKAQGDRVTIHQLLNHTSGIPSYTGLPDFQEKYMREPTEPDSFITVFSEMNLNFEPGTQWSYNNSGYFLLGVIIEKVTGMSYDEALKKRLLEPMGLNNTGYDHFGEIVEQKASGYRKTPVGFEHAAYLDTGIPYAAGMMYSTARDLLKWTRALHTGKPFQKSDTFTKMKTPYMQGYGYGLRMSDDSLGDKPVKRVMHGGGINGFSTMLIYMPEDEYTIVVFDNTQGPSGQIADGLERILFGQPAPPPKQSIGNRMGKIIAEIGFEAAVERYYELKERQPDAFDFSEPELNILGYYYLGEGEIETAIKVLKLNSDVYPKAFNTYDSLGEAYKEAGNKQLAIINYKKSLELNPGNDNARRVLKLLGENVEETSVKVPENLLESYTGKYELLPGFVITVMKENNKMYAQATGQRRVEIIPVSSNSFYLKGVDARLTFHNTNGTVESLTLTQNGRDMPARKIN